MDKKDKEFLAKIDLCCRTADKFIKTYYSTFDKRRHHISRLYLDGGLLAWNGNASKGKEVIQKFLDELPNSEHRVSTLDAQPILGEAVGGQLTYLVNTGGMVKYSGHIRKRFQQTFIITVEEEKWQIANDAYRLQDGLAIAVSN